MQRPMHFRNVQMCRGGRTEFVCQKKKQQKGRVKTNAKANLLPPRQGSSCARKWNIFAKANMCSFPRAGDRNRSVKGAQSWSRVASTEAGQEANETPSQARSRQGSQRRPQKTFANAFPCYKTSTETRAAEIGIEEGVVTASKAGRGSPISQFTVGRSKEGRTDAKAPSLTWRCGFNRGKRGPARSTVL